MLGIKPRSFHMLSKGSSTSYIPPAWNKHFSYNKDTSIYYAVFLCCYNKVQWNYVNTIFFNIILPILEYKTIFKINIHYNVFRNNGFTNQIGFINYQSIFWHKTFQVIFISVFLSFCSLPVTIFFFLTVVKFDGWALINTLFLYLLPIVLPIFSQLSNSRVKLLILFLIQCILIVVLVPQSLAYLTTHLHYLSFWLS